jgi:hypothetical protein
MHLIRYPLSIHKHTYTHADKFRQSLAHGRIDGKDPRTKMNLEYRGEIEMDNLLADMEDNPHMCIVFELEYSVEWRDRLKNAPSHSTVSAGWTFRLLSSDQDINFDGKPNYLCLQRGVGRTLSNNRCFGFSDSETILSSKKGHTTEKKSNQIWLNISIDCPQFSKIQKRLSVMQRGHGRGQSLLDPRAVDDFAREEGGSSEDEDRLYDAERGDRGREGGADERERDYDNGDEYSRLSLNISEIPAHNRTHGHDTSQREIRTPKVGGTLSVAVVGVSGPDFICMCMYVCTCINIYMCVCTLHLHINDDVCITHTHTHTHIRSHTFLRSPAVTTWA